MTKKFLIVDDFDLMRVALQEYVGGIFEIECVTAASVREAKDILSCTDVSLIICDYQMPGANGFKLLEHLIEEKSSIPFILFTSELSLPEPHPGPYEGLLFVYEKKFKELELAIRNLSQFPEKNCLV